MSDNITLDVEGDPVRIALAWAYAAHEPAGAFWPAAFGAACARLPVIYPARRWLREAIRLADRMVDDLVLLERETGWRGPAPREPDVWETDDGLHMAWDTSVSLVLSTTEDSRRLRLTIYGEHGQREALACDAIDRPNTDRAVEAWRDLVTAPAKAAIEAMTDDERAFLSSASAERLEALAAYARLMRRD